MLYVSNITKKYGSFTALDNISFHAEKGHVYGFIGQNGAGKSTTMNIIAGVISHNGGFVTIGGHDLINDPVKARQRLGYMPESAALYPDMTVWEYLDFIAAAKGISKDEINKEIAGVLDRTDIQDLKDKLIVSLSKGMGQRVGIAAALIGSPDVLILDEPTAGLDPDQIASIRKLISSLGKNRTVLLSSHILSEIEEICDSVIIINKGRIIFSDTTDALTESLGDQKQFFFKTTASEKKVREILSNRDYIDSIVLTSDPTSFCTEVKITHRSSNIGERIFSLFSAAKCPLLEMYEIKPSLEDAYRRLIANDNANLKKIGTQGPAKQDKARLSKKLFSLFTEPASNGGKPVTSDKVDADDTYRPLFGKNKN